MKRFFKYTACFLLTVIIFSACKKDDYLKGGTIRSNKVNMTTYDFLKSNSAGLFDTLLLLVDKAGVKDKINQQGISFFAPTDYAINAYLQLRVAQEQNINPLRKWTIDSLIKYELPKFTDSINVYMVNKLLTYDNLTETGSTYATLKPGADCKVSYEETRDPELGYNPNVSTIPRIVYFTCKNLKTRVQTSGIETTTGMLHILANPHLNNSRTLDNDGNVLFFRNK